jgi:hypothetical protein
MYAPASRPQHGLRTYVQSTLRSSSVLLRLFSHLLLRMIRRREKEREKSLQTMHGV